MAAQVLAGPAIKGVKVIAKPLVREVLPSIISTLTGVSKEAARLRLTKAVDPFTKSLLDPAKANQILETTRNELVKRRQELGSRIGKIVEGVHNKFKGNPVVGTQDLANKAKVILTDDFGRISPSSQQIVSLLQTNQGNLTFRQAFQLKQHLQDLVAFKPADITGQRLSPIGTLEGRNIKTIIKDLDERMVSVSPQFRKANQAASSLYKTFEEAEKLFLGKADPQKKALSLLKKGSRERFLLENVDKKLPTAAKFLDSIEKLLVTEEFAPLARPLPRTGFVGGLGIGGALGFLDPRIAALTAAGVAGTSPRLMGALARKGVEAGRAVIKPFERRALRIPAISTIFGEPRAQ